MNHLERAFDGQNQWWKYLIVFFSGLIVSNLIGAIPIGVIYAIKVAQNGMMSQPPNILDFASYGLNPNIGLILLIIPFVLALFTMVILFKPFHKRSITEIVNGTGSIRWHRFLFSFLVWALLLGLVLVIDYSLNPGNFTMQLNVNMFIPLIIISVLLIPFQTTYEEVLFRGYMAQGIAAWTRSRWLVILIPSLIFGLMHIMNPEVKEYGFWLTMPQYISFGLIFGIIAVLDDGIETAMGAHAANNVFASIFVTNKASVLQTAAMFEQHNVNPLKELLVLCIVGILFIAILTFKYKWKLAVVNKPVELP